MSSSSVIEIGQPRIGRSWINWRRASPATLLIHTVLNNADACIVEQQVNQSSDEDSDVEELSDASSGTPRKRRKARQRDDNDLPRWTRNVDIR
jgi:hypothetical protein